MTGEEHLLKLHMDILGVPAKTIFGVTDLDRRRDYPLAFGPGPIGNRMEECWRRLPEWESAGPRGPPGTSLEDTLATKMREKGFLAPPSAPLGSTPLGGTSSSAPGFGTTSWRQRTGGLFDQQNKLEKQAAALDVFNRKLAQMSGLLRGLLDYDPRKRLTADAAFGHKFFRDKPFPSGQEALTALSGRRRVVGE